MNLVKVKTKGQVTLPAAWRQRVRIKVGDVLKVTEEKDKLVLTPQSIIDRRLAESLADIKAGRTYGPFNSVDDMLAFLDKQVKKTKKSQRK